MVSLACPPICPLHAACARLCQPRKPIPPCACASLILTACCAVWAGVAVLPGGGHGPRSPRSLTSGHWNVPAAAQGSGGSWQGPGAGGKHRERPSLTAAQGERPCSPGTDSGFLPTGSRRGVWSAEELAGGSVSEPHPPGLSPGAVPVSSARHFILPSQPPGDSSKTTGNTCIVILT